jgi:hypothetical protein
LIWVDLATQRSIVLVGEEAEAWDAPDPHDRAYRDEAEYCDETEYCEAWRLIALGSTTIEVANVPREFWKQAANMLPGIMERNDADSPSLYAGPSGKWQKIEMSKTGARLRSELSQLRRGRLLAPPAFSSQASREGSVRKDAHILARAVTWGTRATPSPA